MPLDFTDGTLFGNDAGEDELPEVLNSYFVDQPAFRQFLSLTNAFQVARSRKGMGKSALLSKLAYDLESLPDEPLVVRVTGADLIGLLPLPKDAIHLELQNYWQRVICARVNYALGASYGFAFSDNAMALVESAEITGFKERNLVGALIQRIKSSKIPIEVTLAEAPNHEELLKRALSAGANRKVWLLVDDIDSTYVDTEEQKALISTFFSACRSLVNNVKNLRVRVTVRSDVWSNIRKNEDLDKSEQYVTDIYWGAKELEIILSKKILSWYARNGVSSGGFWESLDYRRDKSKIIEYAFVRRMKWGSSSVPPFRPVYILSAGRPRWMAQLCRLSGAEAARQSKELIGKSEIYSIIKKYSGLRLSDIYKEHLHQYADLQRLIETFSNSPARYSTSDLLSQISTSYINAVGSGSIGKIDGHPYNYPMQLAQFLFRVGFIVGRADHNGGDNANFTKFEERPELLTDTRNPDDGLLWEVHPAYRDALNIGKAVRAAKGAEQVQNLSKPGRRRRPKAGGAGVK